MRRKVFFFLLLFLTFHKFAYSENLPPSTCPSGQYYELVSNTHSNYVPCSVYLYVDDRGDRVTDGVGSYDSAPFTSMWIKSTIRYTLSNYKTINSYECQKDVLEYQCTDLPTCDEGQEFDVNLGQCVPLCPPGQHRTSLDGETYECVCDTGYSQSYSGDGALTCTAPECPAMYDSLPLFKVVDQPEDCNYLNMTNGNNLQRPDGKWCCYGQEDDLPEDNCPPNNIEINGECYPISPSPDDNSTPDDHTCPTNYYWSFKSNQCEPFYPDDNITGDSGSSGDAGDTSNSSGTSDNNGTIVIDDSAWFGGEISKDDYKGGLEGYANKSVDVVKDLLDSYVLISLPVNISGSCDSELSKTITVLGNSYTIDLSPHFQKLNNYNSMIYGLVMFVFGIGGVLMVAASGRSD